MVDAV